MTNFYRQMENGQFDHNGYRVSNNGFWLQLNPPTPVNHNTMPGWKFRFSVSDQDLERAWNIFAEEIFNSPYEHAAKVADRNAAKQLMDPDYVQGGKMITLYALDGVPPEEYIRIMKNVEARFEAEGIKPGLTVKRDRKVPGSRYLSYRNENGVDGGYNAARNNLELRTVDAYNQAGIYDPYAVFEVKSNRARWLTSSPVDEAQALHPAVARSELRIDAIASESNTRMTRSSMSPPYEVDVTMTAMPNEVKLARGISHYLALDGKMSGHGIETMRVTKDGVYVSVAMGRRVAYSPDMVEHRLDPVTSESRLFISNETLERAPNIDAEAVSSLIAIQSENFAASGSMHARASEIQDPPSQSFWRGVGKRGGMVAGAVMGLGFAAAAAADGDYNDAGETFVEIAVPYGEAGIELAKGNEEAAAKAAVVETAANVGSAGGAAAGAMAGAAIGVWFGGVGAVPGAVVGGLVGSIVAGIGTGYAAEVTYDHLQDNNDMSPENSEASEVPKTERQPVYDTYDGPESLLAASAGAGVRVESNVLSARQPVIDSAPAFQRVMPSRQV